MASDLTSFAVAFALVGGGLGAYLLYLHRLAVRLEARLDGLRRDGP